MTDHSPGPWRVEKELNSRQYIKTPFYIRTEKKGRLSDYLIATGGLQAEHTTRNGFLIAAAPELLEALRRLVLAFDVGDMKHTTLNGRGYAALVESRAAIASATGEERIL